MELFLVFISFSILLLIFVRTWKRSKSSINLPPGPWRLPIIGNLPQLVGSLPHRRLRDLAKLHGPIMHLQLGQISNVVISSAEAAKEVMKTHDIIFASRPFTMAAEAITYNLRDVAFSPYGDYWRQLKKISTLELFSAKRVQSFRSIREEEVSILIRLVSATEKSPVNLTRMLMATSYSIASRSAFGKEQKLDASFPKVVEKISDLTSGFSICEVFPSIKLLPVITGLRAKLQKVHQELDLILETIMEGHRASREPDNFGSKVEAEDLLRVLMNLQDKGPLEFSLTTQDIKAVLMDIFAAGIETSSSVIEWAMSEMMKNPEVLEKAQTEVRQVFNGKETIDETRLGDLTYLSLVVKEALRLHPPFPLLLPREARERVEIWGYEIPKKTRVLINAWAIGRDPRYWAEAERFYPERFLDNSVDYKGTVFEFIPFGAGRRICPGALFAVSIVELVLANLLYHFDWKLPKPGDLDMTEAFGIAVRRKAELVLIPIPYNP